MSVRFTCYRDWHKRVSLNFEVEDATPYRKEFPSQVEGSPLYCAVQTHSADIWASSDLKKLQRKPEGDGVWSKISGEAIGVFVADCTAALMVGLNPRQEVVALAVHAGWRGTARGILERSIASLELQDLYCWLSPSICQQHYEVGEEVIESLGAGAGDFAQKNPSGKYQLDLKAFQVKKLESLGVKVEVSPLCTWHQPEFHSYRQSQGELQARHLAWLRIEH